MAKFYWILVATLIGFGALSYTQQESDNCNFIVPFTTLLSAHRLSVEDQDKFSKELKILLEKQRLNVELVVHDNFRRPKMIGMGDYFTTYGILACSKEAIIVSDNIEKTNQQVISFDYNRLYGDKKARQLRKVVLEKFPEIPHNTVQ